VTPGELTDRLYDRVKATRYCGMAVFMGYGHGDHMRGMAIARKVPRDRHVTAIIHFTGSMAEFDIAESALSQGVIDEYIVNWGAPRQLAVPMLTQHFDYVYDCIPYPVGVFHAKGPILKHMGFWSAQYQMHPYLCSSLSLPGFNLFNQWEIASQTLGFHVDERDMIAPTTLAPNPGGPMWEHMCEGLCDPHEMAASVLARSPYYTWGDKDTVVSAGRYVIVHNSTGGGHVVKCAPPETFAAIRTRLIADDIQCVQVGDIGDARIEDTIDRRGMRLPLTCQLIKGALAVVCVEGFMAYPAIAMGKRPIVLSGPTPPHLFDCASVITVANTQCPPCFWKHEKWGERCCLGPQANPSGRCLNFAPPDMVAEIVASEVHKQEAILEAEQAAIAEASGVTMQSAPQGAAAEEGRK
jgi:hypothetical protein